MQKVTLKQLEERVWERDINSLESSAEALFDEIKKAVLAGELVSIHGFGSFNATPHIVQSDVNPETSEEKVLILPNFHYSASFRALLN